MRAMTDKQSKLLKQLLQLARGDSELVDEAIRFAAKDREAAPLDDVVSYIEKHVQLERERA